MRVLSRSSACLPAALCAILLAGCEEESRNVGKRPQTRALDQTGVSVGLDSEPAARPQAPAAPNRSGPILGQRTTDIRDSQEALKQPGAQVASQRIVAKDPITLQGNAYVSIIGKASILQIQHAVDLFKATNDRYPKDTAEFMSEIIKANNIALPQLPTYQEYAYDANEHKLIIIEYPDRKN
jgi:hypothetical protein